MRHDAIAAVTAAIGDAKTCSATHCSVTDPATGELHPVVIVTDNGPAFRSAAFARFIASRPELAHVRTRHRSPGSNGVRERGFGTLKYERLYRHDIDDGMDLARHVEAQRQIFNTRRPPIDVGHAPGQEISGHERADIEVPIGLLILHDRHLRVADRDSVVHHALPFNSRGRTCRWDQKRGGRGDR
jgi:transposase InsO family protein